MTFSAPSQSGFLAPDWPADGKLMLLSLRGGGPTYLMDLSRSFHKQTPVTLPSLLNNAGQFVGYHLSPDGKTISGVAWQNGHDVPGIVTYELASQTYSRLNQQGDAPTDCPTTTALVYADGGKFYYLHHDTRPFRLLLSPPKGSPEVLGHPTISHDGRWLDFITSSHDESITLITRE